MVHGELALGLHDIPLPRTIYVRDGDGMLPNNHALVGNDQPDH